MLSGAGYGLAGTFSLPALLLLWTPLAVGHFQDAGTALALMALMCLMTAPGAMASGAFLAILVDRGMIRRPGAAAVVGFVLGLVTAGLGGFVDWLFYDPCRLGGRALYEPWAGVLQGLMGFGNLWYVTLPASVVTAVLIREHVSGRRRDALAEESSPQQSGWVRQQIANTRWRPLLVLMYIASWGYSLSFSSITLRITVGGCYHECAPFAREAFVASLIHLIISLVLFAALRGHRLWRFALLAGTLVLSVYTELAVTRALTHYV